MIDKEKIDIIKKGKPFSLLDIIAIALSLAVCVTVLVVTCAYRKPGATLVIAQAAEGITTKYDLSVDQEITITTAKGEFVVEIKDGAAFVRHSPCIGQDCAEMPEIRYSGQRIICADTRIRISVEGAQKDNLVGTT